MTNQSGCAGADPYLVKGATSRGGGGCDSDSAKPSRLACKTVGHIEMVQETAGSRSSWVKTGRNGGGGGLQL